MGEFGSITRVIGLITVTVWLISTFGVKEFRKPHLFHVLVFFFILWNIASFFWTLEVGRTVKRIQTYVQIAILIYTLWDLYTTRQALIAALEAYILGAYITIGSTIYNFSVGHIISEFEQGRYAGAGINANDLVLILVLGIPVAWHLATSFSIGIKNRFLRLINFAYIPLSLFAIILTGSRTSIFVVLSPILYILWTANRLKPSTRILILTISFGFIVVVQHYYIQVSTLERFATTYDSIKEMDLGGRVELWRKSIALFSDHPILGIGSGSLSTTMGIGSVSHNTYLSILSELGLVGLGLFVFILAIVLYQILNQQKQLFWLWLTVLATWSIGVFTLTWECKKPTWLFLTLIVISANIIREYNIVDQTIPLSVGHFDRLDSSSI